MKEIQLHIKNMVCYRCIKVVKEELENLNLAVKDVKLGEAVILDTGARLVTDEIRRKLEENGFELLDDKKAKTVEQIKKVVIGLIHQNEQQKQHLNFSHLIAEEVGQDYNYLSTLFSNMESITIEQFIILQRIERVKELLVYNELNLSEIAYKTGYSSVQHLSTQFKKVTGLTPSHFKAIKENKRKALDQVK